MWQDHYKTILNSVKNNSRQEYMTDKINSIRGQSILFFYTNLYYFIVDNYL